MKGLAVCLACISCCLVGMTEAALAEVVQADAEVEAVSIDNGRSVNLQVRWLRSTDGQAAGETRFVVVHERRFGAEGVSRIQQLAVSALLARNRIFFVFDNTDNQVTAIRILK